MKIRLISVGKDRSGLFEPGVREYAARISRYCKFELIELSEAPKGRGIPSAVSEEGRRILEKIRSSELFIALDERGKNFSSADLADWLEKSMESGRDIAFCIGGANGISPEIRSRADLVLSLSSMTLPHRLARLITAEQIYRSFTIIKGEPYHRQ